MKDTRETRWGHLNDEDEAFSNRMSGKYIPARGKADTLGGEILRAINRIVYKFYNDGDTVARYYSSGFNDSYGAELFLIKHVPGYKPMRCIDPDSGTHSWGEFEDAVSGNLKTVVDYVRDNPTVFETPNDEDFLDLSPKEEWDDEDEPDGEEW